MLLDLVAEGRRGGLWRRLRLRGLGGRLGSRRGGLRGTLFVSWFGLYCSFCVDGGIDGKDWARERKGERERTE